MLTCPNCQTKNPSGSIQCAACSTSLSPVELKKGTCLFNNTLKITQVLGQGGFGIVYKALHLQHNKFVAVKELFQEDLVTREANQVKIRGGDVTEWQAAILQTQHEFLMLQRLKHESSTKVFAQWQENGTIYTAMELLNGQTLEERIEHQQFLSLSEAKRTLVTLLEVLQELHELGYLHRDIKPSNIMLTSERVELIDFGSLSKFKKGERTKVTNRMLTPEYAPLEQYGSEVVLSPATDLYALAATFCEAITGTRVPNALERLKGASIAPVIARVQQFSSELAMILERALELRLDKRYANTQAMLSALWNPKPIILPAPPEKPEPDYTNLLVVGFFLVLFSTLGVKAIIDGFKWNSSKAGEPPLKRTKTLEEGSRTASVLLKESVTQLELSSDGQVLAAVRSYEYSKEDELWFLDTNTKQLLHNYTFEDEGQETPILQILHHADLFILILRNGTINTYSSRGELITTKKIAPYLTQAAYSTQTKQLIIYKEPIHKYSRAYSAKDLNRFSHGFFVLDAVTLTTIKFIPIPYSDRLKIKIIKARGSQFLIEKTDFSTMDIKFWSINTSTEKAIQMNSKTFEVKTTINLNNIFLGEYGLFSWEKTKISSYDFNENFVCRPEYRIANQTMLFSTPEGLKIYNTKTKKKTKIYTRSSVRAELNYEKSERFNTTIWDYVNTKHRICPYITDQKGIVYAFDTEDYLLLRLK